MSYKYMKLEVLWTDDENKYLGFMNTLTGHWVVMRQDGVDEASGELVSKNVLKHHVVGEHYDKETNCFVPIEDTWKKRNLAPARVNETAVKLDYNSNPDLWSGYADKPFDFSKFGMMDNPLNRQSESAATPMPEEAARVEKLMDAGEWNPCDYESGQYDPELIRRLNEMENTDDLDEEDDEYRGAAAENPVERDWEANSPGEVGDAAEEEEDARS